MAKSEERKCPKCGVVSKYRVDQKTCASEYCKSLKEPKIEDQPPSNKEAYLKSENADLRRQLASYKWLSGFQTTLKDSIIDAIEAVEPLKPVKYTSGGKADAEMAAVIKLSDWHIGAVTNYWETEGFGEFNWALAQERVQYITVKFLEWIETHRKSFKIPKVYILSEGDMVSGDIHYELQVTNEFPAPVQAVKAGSLLAQMVANIAPHFPEVHFSQINIDNHSRLTKKLQFAQGGENSWGYVVHEIANAKLAKHGNINYITTPGIRQVVNVNGVNFLTEHGHEVKAWMGIPFYGLERLRGREATKRIQAMLEQERQEYTQFKKDIGFDYLSCGHWHVPGLVSGNMLINGCLPGTTEYDAAYGRFARPSQVSFLVHPKYKIFDLTPWTVKR